MPLYKFEDEETGEIVDVHCSISEIDDVTYQKELDGFVRVWSVNIVSGKSTGLRKMDDGFNDILKDIKKKSGRGSTIQTK